MNKSKVGIDFSKVERARHTAREIANEVQEFVDRYTTVAVERTLCRFIGIDDVDANGVPLPNVVVNHLHENKLLSDGALFYIANAMAATGKNPQQVAEGVAEGTIDLKRYPSLDKEGVANTLEPYILGGIKKIAAKRARREEYLRTIGEGPQPYLYVIVAPGCRYYCGYPHHGTKFARLCTLWSDHRRFWRYVCYSRKLPHHAQGFG